MNRYQNTFEICARAIIINKNKILVCVGKKDGTLFFPGGHIEFGETAEIALKRELIEELNVTAEKISYIGTVENIYNDKNMQHHEINLIFKVNVKNIHNISQEDHIDFVFLSKEEFKKSKLQPIALKNNIIKWLKNKKSFWGTQI